MQGSSKDDDDDDEDDEDDNDDDSHRCKLGLEQPNWRQDQKWPALAIKKQSKIKHDD